MVRPALRSHSMARKKRKLPGGTNTIHYIRRTPKRAHCQDCGAILGGVPRARQVKMKNHFPKNQRRPERPFAGNLCHKCVAARIKAKVKEEARRQ